MTALRTKKFLVIYERRSSFPFGTRPFIGYELVKSKTFASAYNWHIAVLQSLEQLNHIKIRIRSIEEVSDDFKPSDIHIASFAQVEELHRHREAMAKVKGKDEGIKK